MTRIGSSFLPRVASLSATVRSRRERRLSLQQSRATIPFPNHYSSASVFPAFFCHSSSPGIFTFTPVSQVDGGACADSWTLSPKPSRIFDCFMFFNEIAMLRLRLRVHSPIVDYFVIRCQNDLLRCFSLESLTRRRSESTMTHAGKTKPMHFWDRRDEFKEW